MHDGEVFIAAFSIFAVFIAMPWIILHFLSKRREEGRQSAGDPALNAQLNALAERLEQRLDAIESLLDHEMPGWKKPQERRNV